MEKSAGAERAPNPIDRHVGLRIRLRRRELGVSQEALAESIGLTFQQVQKYERAANRVSASKLWEVACALSTSVAYFYEGLGGGAPDAPRPPNEAVHEFLQTPEGIELAAAFPKLGEGRARRKILELVRVIAEDDRART